MSNATTSETESPNALDEHSLVDADQFQPNQAHAQQTVRQTWNFGTDQIRANTTHYTPDQQEKLLALFRWCIDPLHPLRREDAAQRLDCSPELLYQLLTGKYRNPDRTLKQPGEAFMARLTQFLEDEARKFKATVEDFVMTPTAQKIFTACDLARESHSPVMIEGPSQIGKTTALRNYQATHNHGRTYLAELDASGGMPGLKRTLALSALGINSSLANTNALVDRIKAAISPNTVLIIDEMHLLEHTYQRKVTVACNELIRRIWDATQCGMVLTWTNMQGFKDLSQSELVQLWRRGVHKYRLPLMPTKADLTALASHYGLEFPELARRVTIGKVTEQPYEILRQQARNNGLKAVTERLRYAKKLATKKGEDIDWKHFVDAHLRIEKQYVQEGYWE